MGEERSRACERIVLTALRKGGVDGDEGGLALKEQRLPLPGRRRAFLFSTPIPMLIFFWRSARAEWLERREGWLRRSGASPSPGRQMEDGAGGPGVLACV